MGSSISGVLAKLFMDKLGRMTLSQQLLIDPYKCFVDDMYLQTEDENQADNIHRNMNQLHPRIKFEIEKPIKTPEGKTLSLLDFSVTITNEGDASFEFYKKKAKKPLFTNYKSNQTKSAMIKNERNRINQRCSSMHTKVIHNKDFDEILRVNGYPQ